MLASEEVGGEAPASAAMEQQRPDAAAVYKEMWQHIRHMENQRLTFTTLYFALFGAGYGFVISNSQSSLFLDQAVLALLFVASYFGLAISVRISLTFWTHIREIRRLQAILDPGTFDTYENQQQSVEDMIYEEEGSYFMLNKMFILLSRFGPVSLPLTLLFPLIYTLGGLVCILTIAFNIFFPFTS